MVINILAEIVYVGVLGKWSRIFFVSTKFDCFIMPMGSVGVSWINYTRLRILLRLILILREDARFCLSYLETVAYGFPCYRDNIYIFENVFDDIFLTILLLCSYLNYSKDK